MPALSWGALGAALALLLTSTALTEENSSAVDEVSLGGVVRCPSGHPRVVYVQSDDIVAAPRSHSAVLDQRGLVFVPHVLAVMVGTRVAFLNSDPVLHNVFSASETKLFNLGTYPAGVTRYVTFDRPGVVEILCNVHHEMGAYILVLPTPHFTLTDSDGRFRLDGLPPGETQIVVWCEVHGFHQKRVKLTSSGTNRVELDEAKEPALDVDFGSLR